MVRIEKLDWSFLVGFLLLSGFLITGHYNYLLFHTLGEMFALVVALGGFTLLWNNCRFVNNDYPSLKRIDLIHAVACQLEQLKFEGN